MTNKRTETHKKYTREKGVKMYKGRGIVEQSSYGIKSSVEGNAGDKPCRRSKNGRSCSYSETKGNQTEVERRKRKKRKFS